MQLWFQLNSKFADMLAFHQCFNATMVSTKRYIINNGRRLHGVSILLWFQLNWDKELKMFLEHVFQYHYGFN